MLQVYRIVKGIDKLDFNHFFKFDENPTRGHSYKLSKPRAETRLRLNSFSHRVINVWNNLSDKTVSCDSLNSFKSALEKEWQNNPKKFNWLG